jgi:Ser/Thr protein kinase RdoA (MazF antagonist)
MAYQRADVAKYQPIAREFGLGRPLEVRPLADGHPSVVKLTTELGQFVVKPGYSPAQAELYERVALILNQAGIRQASPRRSAAGSLLSESGHAVQAFLPGRTFRRPSRAQTAATMRHTGAYHAALQQLPIPAALLAEETVWTRVASPAYLLQTLPGLLHRASLPVGGQDAVATALGHVETFLPQIRQLPRQLVHGDIGPDNVLMNADEVIAIVDFTPFGEPVLFGIATAVYWYHVYGHRTLEVTAIRASVAAASEHRRWTSTEVAAWPAMLLREALRRLATPIALAAETGAPMTAGVEVRWQAVYSIVRSWSDLQSLAAGDQPC